MTVGNCVRKFRGTAWNTGILIARDARRHSEAQRVLLGRVLDEVEDLAPERFARSRKSLARTDKSRTWAEA
jgi:hypothetical protein